MPRFTSIPGIPQSNITDEQAFIIFMITSLNLIIALYLPLFLQVINIKR